MNYCALETDFDLVRDHLPKPHRYGIKGWEFIVSFLCCRATGGAGTVPGRNA